MVKGESKVSDQVRWLEEEILHRPLHPADGDSAGIPIESDPGLERER